VFSLKVYWYGYTEHLCRWESGGLVSELRRLAGVYEDVSSDKTEVWRRAPAVVEFTWWNLPHLKRALH
jgi:hypothetical protein